MLTTGPGFDKLQIMLLGLPVKIRFSLSTEKIEFIQRKDKKRRKTNFWLDRDSEKLLICPLFDISLFFHGWAVRLSSPCPIAGLGALPGSLNTAFSLQWTLNGYLCCCCFWGVFFAANSLNSGGSSLRIDTWVQTGNSVVTDRVCLTSYPEFWQFFWAASKKI